MKYSTSLTAFGDRQQQLLRALLRQRGGLTIDELVEEVQVTRTAIKQHLRALEDAGYVAEGHLRSARGRPSRVFVITPRGTDLFPKQYSWFSSEVLRSLKAASGSSGLSLALRAIAVGIARSLRSRIGNHSLNQRIEKLQEVMTEIGYEATTKKIEGSRLPVIEAYNCVYHDLALEHPEVCAFDLELVSKLTDSEVTHSECMVRGGKCCRFVFQEPKG